MFLGLRTAIYYANDIEKAKEWYTSILATKPYFDEPFYVGFNVAGYELGLHPGESRFSDTNSGTTGVVAYWGVENAEDSFRQLLDLGATKHEDVQDVGGGIKVATVKDPFGNVFGIIENPDFKL